MPSGDQSTFNSGKAFSAWKGVSAMTATPPLPPFRPSTSSTFFTPGDASAAAASKLTTLPPRVGHMLTLAYSMPGSTTSRPKRALPSILPALSSRATGLPMSLKSFGSFSATLLRQRQLRGRGGEFAEAGALARRVRHAAVRAP